MEDEIKAALSAESGAAEPEETLAQDNIRTIDEELEEIRAQIEDSNTEKDNLKDMLQRVQADFVNYRRRSEEEREELQRQANTRLILKLLPVLDDFNLALDHASASEAEAPWLEGVKLIQRKFYSLLESENVTRCEVDGSEFDPFEHEALAYQESEDHREGQILTVVRDGYRLHGKVIRPALVILAKQPEAATGQGGPSTEKETEDA